jgi:hypothetical protein
VAFSKALAEVSTDVDDDDDPADSIKEYGKDLLVALTLHGIGEAHKIVKLAKKAWRFKKSKLKAPPPYRAWGKRVWQGGAPVVAASPAAATLTPAASTTFTRPVCPVCGRTGHTEATCYTAHPELRVTKP